MPLPPPTPPPFSLRLALKDLNLNVTAPVAVVLALILVGVPSAMDAVKEWAAAPAHQEPPGGFSSVRAPAFAALGNAALQELPMVIQGQALPPCEPDLERRLRDACWIPLDVSPCPKGKAFINDKGPEADGKCYTRAMKAARSPTSGEPRPHAIADP